MDYISFLKGRGLNQTAKLIYICLVGNYRYHKKEFYTYESFLADKLEVDERTIRRGIKKLKDVGLISIKREFNKTTNKTVNYYTVQTPYIEESGDYKKILLTGFTA